MPAAEPHSSPRRSAASPPPTIRCRRPTVNNLGTRDLATVSKDIHTDSQLHPRFPGNVAFLGCVHAIPLLDFWNCISDSHDTGALRTREVGAVTGEENLAYVPWNRPTCAGPLSYSHVAGRRRRCLRRKRRPGSGCEAHRLHDRADDRDRVFRHTAQRIPEVRRQPRHRGRDDRLAEQPRARRARSRIASPRR